MLNIDIQRNSDCRMQSYLKLNRTYLVLTYWCRLWCYYVSRPTWLSYKCLAVFNNFWAPLATIFTTEFMCLLWKSLLVIIT